MKPPVLSGDTEKALSMSGSDDAPGFDPSTRPWETVVFSLKDDFVWAAWPGAAGCVNLGRYGPVRVMMQDFLDQSALGERLVGPKHSDSRNLGPKS